MKLIITEKDNTAKKIAEILSGGKAKREGKTAPAVYRYENGEDEAVCVGLRGHVMAIDFPENYQNWEKTDPKNLITADIIKTPKQKTIVNKVKSLAKTAAEIVIATDYDREGELIGWDIANEIGSFKTSKKVMRARFSALTKHDISEAFKNLEKIDENLASAGEARQDIDLIWGASLTRFISIASNRRGNMFLSAGRVQTPTLALIVEREKERRAFEIKKFWVVKIKCLKGEEFFWATHRKERFTELEEAEDIMRKLSDKAEVISVKERKSSQVPPAPMNTTALLSSASSLFGMTPNRVMSVAEKLYMEGLISYPRVDNTVYPETLDIRKLLEELSSTPDLGYLCEEIMKKKEIKPTRGKKHTTDHPPIHPTGTASKASLQSQEWKVYELVFRRFLATLADKSRSVNTTVDLLCSENKFYARGSRVEFEGWMKFYSYGKKKDIELPEIKEKEVLSVTDKEMEEKETQPPAAFSQSKLIEKMEELGLGTKATRHSIIEGLFQRGYVHGDPIHATETGIAVIEALKKYAKPISTPNMTSELEADMDAIVEGRESRTEVVDKSRELLKDVFEDLEKNRQGLAEEIRGGITEDKILGICSECEKEGRVKSEEMNGEERISKGYLRIKKAKKGGQRFAGCDNYPECRSTFPLPQDGTISKTDEKCTSCGSPMIKVTNGKKKEIFCLNPKCETKKTKDANGKGIKIDEEQFLGKCTAKGCDGRLKVRANWRTGERFAGCDKYPKCKTTYPLFQKGDIEAAEKECSLCGAPIVSYAYEDVERSVCIDPKCKSHPESDEFTVELRKAVREDIEVGKCPKCNGNMKLRKARKTGKRFAGCSKFPKCRQTYNLPQDGELIPLSEKCELCASPMFKVKDETGAESSAYCMDSKCEKGIKPASK